MKSFKYVNSLGYNKELQVYPDKVNEKGEYYVMLWAGQTDAMETTGAFCGDGYMSVEKLNNYLAHFGIDYKF